MENTCQEENDGVQWPSVFSLLLQCLSTRRSLQGGKGYIHSSALMPSTEKALSVGLPSLCVGELIKYLTLIECGKQGRKLGL